jgi:uncharacterized protein (TIGR00369 family)
MDERTRTVTWDDPMVGATAARGLGGREYLQALLDGKFPPPPIARLLGFGLEAVGDGWARFATVPAEFHYNPIGVVHGGLAATLLDSAMGCAVQSTLPAGVGYTTVELHVNLVRALTKDTGRVTCEAKVVHAGRTLATAEGRVVDAAGKLHAHGTTTCMILRA